MGRTRIKPSVFQADDHEEDLIGGNDMGQVPNIGEDLNYRTDSEVFGLNGGVSIPWLVKAFHMGRYTVENKLTGCNPVGKGKHGSPLYSLTEAAAFLITPVHDIKKYLEDVKPEDLPEKLRDSYWSSKLKQQRFEEKAGSLWRTEAVLDVISGVLQDIRSKLQLVPEEMRRLGGSNDEQQRIIGELIEAVQEDIYQSILRLSSTSFTPNQLGEENGTTRNDEDII